jgi:hypothetical protein
VSDSVHSPIEVVFFDVNLLMNNLSTKELDVSLETRRIAYRFDDLEAFQSRLTRPCELEIASRLADGGSRRVLSVH